MLLCGYIAFCALQHRRALAAWRRIDAPTAGERLAVLPQFLSPFRWLGLSDRPGEVHAAFFDIGPFARGVADPRAPGERSPRFSGACRTSIPLPSARSFSSSPSRTESPALAAARALPDVPDVPGVRAVPAGDVEPQPDGATSVTWEDLRFLPWFSGPWQRDGKDGLRRQPFLYRVRLDASGRVLDRAFVPTLAVRAQPVSCGEGPAPQRRSIPATACASTPRRCPP